MLSQTGHERWTLLTTLVGGIVTVGLVIPGAFMFGANGVAGAVAVGMALNNALQVIMVKRLTGMRTYISVREGAAYTRSALDRRRSQ